MDTDELKGNNGLENPFPHFPAHRAVVRTKTV